MLDLVDKTITVIGAQRSGMALAKLITRLKGKVKISEKSPRESLPEEFKDWMSRHAISFEAGGHTRPFIEESDLIVLSPGVRLDSQPVQWARAKGIPVLGEIEFSFQFCSRPVIAITGSNGKTTVSSLTTELLKEAGYPVWLCGNIGHPFSAYILSTELMNPKETISSKLESDRENLKQKGFVVLEVSSFQLESLLDPDSPFRTERHPGELSFNGFKPWIAVMLNFSPNHLDRHKDCEEYFSAKKRIFLNQDDNDFAVLNHSDHQTKALSSQIYPRVVCFNISPQESLGGMDNPNHLAVLEVAKILDIDSNLCQRVLREFKGVEHRLEWVRSLQGIDFINDSKATTPQAAAWALQRIHKPIFMICGGRDKNLDFSVLSELIQRKVKKMFIIGEAKEKIKKTFQGLVPIEDCFILEEAVSKARENARQGDCVLLSPMCTSFDMFADFEQRGRFFKEIVNTLK